MTNDFPDRVDHTPGTVASPSGTVSVDFLDHVADGRRHVLDLEVADEATLRRIQSIATKSARIVAATGSARLPLVVERLVLKPLVGVGDRVHNTVVVEGIEQ